MTNAPDAQSADRWEHFDHGADIGVRGVAATKAGAFAQAARALSAVVTELEAIRPDRAVEVNAAAPDDEVLLLDWLNALIYEMATRAMLFSRFEVDIADHRLHATAWGEAVDRARHRPAVEIKGATFTELAVSREGDEWRAQCVLDV